METAKNKVETLSPIVKSIKLIDQSKNSGYEVIGKISKWARYKYRRYPEITYTQVYRGILTTLQ